MVKTTPRRMKINASVPKELFEEFDRFVSQNGYVKERAVAGAIRLFMAADFASRANAMTATLKESN